MVRASIEIFALQPTQVLPPLDKGVSVMLHCKQNKTCRKAS